MDLKQTCDPAGAGAMLTSGFGLHQPPVRALTDFRTPTPEVFHVTHLGVVGMPAQAWRLSVGGMVERPLDLGWDDLALMPRRRVIAAHECAGSPLAPTRPVRRIANVEWEGVPLAHVLQKAGVHADARFVWSTGADQGPFNDLHHVGYQKDLPIAKALAEDTLLATHMNGEPLAAERGGPVRLVVPGYYGTNSTKWIHALELREQRANSHFTTTLYNDTVESGGKTLRRPVWGIAPHSLIVSHAEGSQYAAGAQEISGWAWALSGIAAVEVSVDGGASWQGAELAPRVDFSWQRFCLPWSPAPGSHRLLCRATANDGAIQPATGARNEWFSLDVSIGQ